MACCLTTPSHYLNQCWIIISEVFWHSPIGNFTWNSQNICSSYEFANYSIKNMATSLKVQWVNSPLTHAMVCCDYILVLVRERQLRWFGHVMRSNGEINRVRSRPVPGRKGPGRPKKTWDECVKQDLKVCGLSEAGTQDRVSWRSSVKNSRQEPTPSNGSAPQSMAAPPARRVLGMRTRSFNKIGFDWLIYWYCRVDQKQQQTWEQCQTLVQENSRLKGELEAVQKQ